MIASQDVQPEQQAPPVPNRVVLVRVGIDSGSGGIHGPLFRDGTFEYVPIPDGAGIDERTYGNTVGRCGQPLVEFFPAGRRGRMADCSMHLDPEFTTFTYGDPSTLKSGLRRLKRGDLLVFYCGLRGWDGDVEPALYLLGYFEVQLAARAGELCPQTIEEHFARNFHVRHPAVFAEQRERLVLVRGGEGSRLLTRAVRISALGNDRRGKLFKVLSPAMQEIFGDFGGVIGIQRSSPRWVDPAYLGQAAAFLRSLQ